RRGGTRGLPPRTRAGGLAAAVGGLDPALRQPARPPRRTRRAGRSLGPAARRPRAEGAPPDRLRSRRRLGGRQPRGPRLRPARPGRQRGRAPRLPPLGRRLNGTVARTGHDTIPPARRSGLSATGMVRFTHPTGVSPKKRGARAFNV